MPTPNDPSAEPRRSGARRLLNAPIALVSAMAVALGIAPPAHAAPEPAKRSLKPGLDGVRTLQGQNVASTNAPAEYVVVDGDTVSGIADRFGVRTADVLTRNGLSWTSTIFPGQRLALASTTSPTPERLEITRHTVSNGDTIIGIAGIYGIDTDALLSINGLDRASLIFPGQSIVLPTGSVPATAATAMASNATPSEATHTVVSGDTLIDIADSYGISFESLLDANALGPRTLIFPDQQLVIPNVAPVDDVVDVTTTAHRVIELTDEMRGNADLIIDIGRSLGVPDEGIVVALAAAAQESTLRNLDHGDRDSLGLFQQRPSQGWGTVAEVLDPSRAATAFFGGSANPNPGRTRGLLDIDGWQSMSVNDAAQQVQRSGFPAHYGKWETSARAWLADLG